MTTTRIPLVAQINVTIVSQAVTAAYGSAGDLVNYSAACSSVLLRNPGEVWPIEFKVGSGAWQRLEIYNTTLLSISLDTTTIRVRKALENSGSGLVQLDIRGLASTYLAGDDAVDLGGEGGGADPRLPETLDPLSRLLVNAEGTGLICADPPKEFDLVIVHSGDTTGDLGSNLAARTLYLFLSAALADTTFQMPSLATYLAANAWVAQDPRISASYVAAQMIVQVNGTHPLELGSSADETFECFGNGPIQPGETTIFWIDVSLDEAVPTAQAYEVGVDIVQRVRGIPADAVASQSVLVAGVGTMVFTRGVLTSFTPA